METVLSLASRAVSLFGRARDAALAWVGSGAPRGVVEVNVYDLLAMRKTRVYSAGWLLPPPPLACALALAPRGDGILYDVVYARGAERLHVLQRGACDPDALPEHVPRPPRIASLVAPGRVDLTPSYNLFGGEAGPAELLAIAFIDGHVQARALARLLVRLAPGLLAVQVLCTDTMQAEVITS